MNADREYIICSAILRKEPIEGPNNLVQKDIYRCELGYRHCDIFEKFKKQVDENNQGFFTSKGRFVDRKEAYLIAVSQGQCKVKSVKILFSEDIFN